MAQELKPTLDSLLETCLTFLKMFLCWFGLILMNNNNQAKILPLWFLNSWRGHRKYLPYLLSELYNKGKACPSVEPKHGKSSPYQNTSRPALLGQEETPIQGEGTLKHSKGSDCTFQAVVQGVTQRCGCVVTCVYLRAGWAPCTDVMDRGRPSSFHSFLLRSSKHWTTFRLSSSPVLPSWATAIIKLIVYCSRKLTTHATLQRTIHYCKHHHY